VLKLTTATYFMKFVWYIRLVRDNKFCFNPEHWYKLYISYNTENTARSLILTGHTS